jgi:hypothetical protein
MILIRTLFSRLEKEKYIAKYYNPMLTTASILGRILEVLNHLNEFNVPRPVRQLSGGMLSAVSFIVSFSYKHVLVIVSLLVSLISMYL